MPPEELWDNLLSHQPALVNAAFDELKEEEQAAVLAHLRRMVTEAGWQPEQRDSARAALQALGEGGER